MKRWLSHYLAAVLLGGFALFSACESPEGPSTTYSPPETGEGTVDSTEEPSEDGQAEKTPTEPPSPPSPTEPAKEDTSVPDPAEKEAAGKAQPPEQVSIEGINETFTQSDLDVSAWVKQFEGEGREVYAKRNQILKATGIESGDVVADIGAGTGFYTMLFAERVGAEGKVFAVDVSERFLEHIRQRVKQAGRENVEVLKGTQQSTNLPENAIDVAFVCDAYHHFEYPRAMLASIRTALREGGELFLIEFDKAAAKGDEFIMKHVRAGKETFTSEIEAAGFEKVEEYDILEKNYAIQFVKE